VLHDHALIGLWSSQKVIRNDVSFHLFTRSLVDIWLLFYFLNCPTCAMKLISDYLFQLRGYAALECGL